MTQYIFHESGVIPGWPASFANCIVEVGPDGKPFIGDDGEVITLPLFQLPHNPPEEEPVGQPAPMDESKAKPAKADVSAPKLEGKEG